LKVRLVLKYAREQDKASDEWHSEMQRMDGWVEESGFGQTFEGGEKKGEVKKKYAHFVSFNPSIHPSFLSTYELEARNRVDRLMPQVTQLIIHISMSNLNILPRNHRRI
jgi:hypothetical protein